MKDNKDARSQINNFYINIMEMNTKIMKNSISSIMKAYTKVAQSSIEQMNYSLNIVFKNDLQKFADRINKITFAASYNAVKDTFSNERFNRIYDMINSMDWSNISINDDTVSYEDESVNIKEITNEDIINALNSINDNVSDIKKNTKPTPKIILIILFIISRNMWWIF